MVKGLGDTISTYYYYIHIINISGTYIEGEKQGSVNTAPLQSGATCV